jgi:RimJ/RimL family protein N-acetyltransferase
MAVIRKAKLIDMDEIVELWKRFMDHQKSLERKEDQNPLPHFREGAPDRVREYFSRSIRSRHGFVLVLEDQGGVQGYSLCRIQKNIPVFEHDQIGYISDIYLEEPYRGKGYSSEMWERSLEWFRKKGIHQISIRVLSCNPAAHKVYEHWGFRDLLIEMNLDI